MDNSKKSPNLGRERESHVADAASELLNEGKKYAHELYEHGADKVAYAQDSVKEHVKEHSDNLIKLIQKNPLGSVLIAAGVGMVLSSLFKK